VRIAVLIPTSGAYSFFGKQFLNGILFSDYKNTKYKVKFLIVNLSHNDHNTTIKDIFYSLYKKNISAIIGPLFPNQLKYFSRYSAKYKIPVISPAPVKFSVYKSPYLFHYGMTLKDQLKADLKYAKERGVDVLTVIYPDDNYGQTAASNIKSIAAKYGLDISNMAAYSKKTVDFFYNFNSIVSFQNVGHGNLTKAQQKELGVTPYDLMHGVTAAKPKIPFNGLFVIGSIAKLKLILTQLTYYNITGVHIFGLSTFDSPSFLEKNSFYMQRAVFPDGFFLHGNNPYVKNFISLYSKYYSDEPNILSAEGYDIGTILIKAVHNEGELQKKSPDIKQSFNSPFLPSYFSNPNLVSRHTSMDILLYHSLLNIKVFKGVCGISRLYKRNFKKSLYLFEFKNDKIYVLNTPY
jgi:ABC-type branched-subunit amino acid transport system substrate-binding protein